MPRLFVLFFFLSVAAAVSAQEKPSVSFAPSEIHRFRDGLTAPAILPPKSDLAQPIQQVAGMTPQQPVKMTQPVQFATVPDAELTEQPEPAEQTESVLDKPLSFNNKESKEKTGLPNESKRPKLTGSIAPFVSVAGSLLIVLSVFFVLVYLMKKVSPAGSRQLPKEVFENLGRTQLTQKIQLNLLRLGNRLILVSITADGVQALTEVTDTDEVVPLLGMCRQLDKNSSTEVFRKTLAKFSTDESERTESGEWRAEGGKKSKQQSTPLTSRSSKPALVDLYSDPDASLAEILVKGLGRS
jgi:flagellar biogenesis protein FliO